MNFDKEHSMGQLNRVTWRLEVKGWQSIDSWNTHDGLMIVGQIGVDYSVDEILAATHDEKSSAVQIRAEDVSPDVIGRRVIATLCRGHLSWRRCVAHR